MRPVSPVSVLLTLVLSTASCGGDSPVTGTPDPDPVEPPVATSLTLDAGAVAVDHHGGTAVLQATVLDQAGRAMSGVTVSWSTADPAVAAVDATGRITGLAPGETVVTAAAGALTAQATATTLLQPNARCRVPGPASTPSAAAGPPAFQEIPGAFEHLAHRYNQSDEVAWDYDADGDKDIVVFASNFPTTPTTEQGGRVYVRRNDGGRFTLVLTGASDPDSIRSDHTRQFELADFDGDGATDLFAAQHGWDTAPFPGAPNLLLLAGPAGMREVAAARFSPHRTNGFTHASASADVDCDGDADIVTSNLVTPAGQQATHLYLNAGPAQFVQDDARLPASMRNSPVESFTAATMCDVDRDGDPDLFLGGWPAPAGTGRSRLLMNDGFAAFRLPLGTLLPAEAYGPASSVVDAVCSDLDRDGWNDLIVSVTPEYTAGTFQIWRNRGDGTGALEDVTAAWAPNSWPTNWIPRVFVEDFNGDGWPDLFAYGHPTRNQRLYVNRGGGGFDEVVPPSPHLDLRPVDADGDGRMDLYWPGNAGDPTAAGTGILYRSR